MTSTTNDTLRLALEALVSLNMPMSAAHCDTRNSAIGAIERALARPQEVAGVTEAEIIKAANIGAVYTERAGRVERRPEEYRKELEGEFLRGARWALSKLPSCAASRAPVAVGVEPKINLEAFTDLAMLKEADTLRAIAGHLEVMLASAQQHHDGEAITGYTIKTGALHRIIGLLVGAGFRVIVPLASAPKLGPFPQPEVLEGHYRDHTDKVDGYSLKQLFDYSNEVLREFLAAHPLQAQDAAPVKRHCDTCGHMVTSPCRSAICSTRDAIVAAGVQGDAAPDSEYQRKNTELWNLGRSVGK